MSAVYNVLPYLDDFIASIERQRFPLDRVEIVLVDDGSTDGSAKRLAEWQAARPGLVTVLTKPNGGQASARNVGLERASGEWVTFTDPDDMLEPDALTEIDAFIRANPAVQLAAMRRELLFDATGQRGRHPLQSHFAKRNRLVDLDDSPHHFYGSAPCAFFRLAEIRRLGLSFHEDIRPSFEDGYFCIEYLLKVGAPMVGFVTSATYVYRKRADTSSTLARARTDVQRYTTLFERGYVGILDVATELRGRVPDWLQTHIMYELSYRFSEEHRASSELVLSVLDETHRQLAEIAARLDERNIRSFSLRRFLPEWRDILVHGYTGQDWHAPYAVVDRVDMKQRLLRLTYRYVGELPEERFVVDGQLTKPFHHKIRSQPYFQRTIVRHRVVWLPYGAVEAMVGGVSLALELDEPTPPRTSLAAWRARDRLVPQYMRRATERESPERTLWAAVVRRLASTRLVRRRYGKAWILIDRLHDADDSAEHLFRYLRRRQPEVNAWFVVERSSPDHKRLRRDGHRRVVSPGSMRWTLLMLNCEHLISSHADAPITAPPAIRRLIEPSWRFTFLQHGVTKDDLSEWLNPKKLDLFVVSTRAEYDSVVADDTAYDYTDREVCLTGLPRFDVLLEAAASLPEETRDLVLIAPTWRQWLVTSREGAAQRWDIDLDEFRRSEFATNWRALLGSDELRERVRKAGLRLGLLMHPNLQAVAPALDLPADVEQLFFSGRVSDTFARTHLLVTDYSSMAFNAAYLERPVVYFQFDRDRVLGGGHVGRRGYFDYERDGFGPVARSVSDAVGAIVGLVASGAAAPAPPYDERILSTFPARDGRCSERVYEAIVASSRRRDDAVHA